MILLTCLLIYLVSPTFEQSLPGADSPCPEVFSYEPSGERERWYGVVNVTSDTTLYGLWLTILLDGKAHILGNWLGDVTTRDNTAFRIEKTDLILLPGVPTKVQFFVQYDPLGNIPRLKSIKLNGLEICSSETEKEEIAVTPKDQSVIPVQEIPKVERIKTVPTTTDRITSTTSTSIPKTGAQIFEESLSSDIGVIQHSSKLQSQCGKVLLNKVVPLVVNGQPTREGQWPWQVAIYQTQRLDFKYICGGTLVSRAHIITAAHCVTRPRATKIVNERTLTVYLGKHNLETSVEGVQSRFVGSIMVYPKYSGRTYMNDIAILELREPVLYSERVQPACLWPEDKVDLTNIVGLSGSVVGWGVTEKATVTEELLLVEMPVVDTETCLRSYSDFFLRYTTPYTYCAGYRNGSSVCTGDSGGGMVFKNGDTWYIRGVVSLAVGLLSGDLPCDTSQYVVFTDVAKHLDWVKSIVHSY